MSHKFFTFLILVLLLYACHSVCLSNIAEIQISVPPSTNSEGLVFTPGLHALSSQRASIISGSFSGLSFGFSAKTHTGEVEVFSIQLPSTNDIRFSIKNWAKKEIEVQTTRPFPWIITPQSYEGVFTGQAHQPLKARVIFQREKKRDSQSTDVKYLSPTLYTLTINSLKIENGLLWISGQVEGKIDPAYRIHNDADYSLSAKFSLEGVLLTEMLVDD